jgi:bifunctional non-homologous end joining protein LigD
MSQQLPLPLDGPASPSPALPSRLGFPVATEGGRPFDDDERFFEPWWPGAHVFVCRSGDHVEIRTEHLSDPLTTFPELRVVAQGLATDGVIVEGTLLALDGDGRPDTRLLRRVLNSGGPSADAEGALVLSDLVYAEGRSLARHPFVERRRRLSSLLPASDRCVLSRGLVGEGVTLGRAVADLGLSAISARRLDGRWRAGDAGDDWVRLRTDQPATLPTRPFLVLLERLPLAG